MREDLRLWTSRRVIGCLRDEDVQPPLSPLALMPTQFRLLEAGFAVDAPYASVYGFAHHGKYALGLRVAEFRPGAVAKFPACVAAPMELVDRWRDPLGLADRAQRIRAPGSAGRCVRFLLGQRALPPCSRDVDARLAVLPAGPSKESNQMSSLVELLGWIRRPGISEEKEVELIAAKKELEESLNDLALAKKRLEVILTKDETNQHKIKRAIQEHGERTREITRMAERALTLVTGSKP